MTSTFPAREQAFEAKFAPDEEHRFLVKARRDKLFGAWAADRLHLPENEKQALAGAVLKVLDGRGHDDALIALIDKTLRDHGQIVPTNELGAALGRCFDEAEKQISGSPHFSG